MKNDLVITNANIVDVSSKRVFPGEVFISGKVIASVRRNSGKRPGGGSAKAVLDAGGGFLSPGLIDGHLHIESSMLAPLEFAKQAVLHGTTAIFVDPHEIANVLGRKGIGLFLKEAGKLPLDMYIGVPSCVPATDLETSGGSISIRDIKSLLKNPRVFGLAEMMNFPGIVHGFGDARERVEVALRAGKMVDGHCPGLSGEDLKRYVSNGKRDGIVRIMSDHESVSAEEALEKYRAGMFIHIRYGSASKDLDRILPELVRKRVKLDRFGLACDDLDVEELYEQGHMDRAVRRARDIFRENSGFGPEKAAVAALALATRNNAEYFSPFFRKQGFPVPGEIAKGRKADLVIFDSLDDMKVRHVIHSGKVVVRYGRLVFKSRRPRYEPWTHTVHVRRDFSVDDFRIPYHGNMKRARDHVIGVIKNSLLTEDLMLPVKVERGKAGAELVSDPARDIVKIAVIERHKKTGNYTVGFVRGLGIRRGAVASTIAHDSHNLIVAGTDKKDMAKAVNFLAHTGGGLVVAKGKSIDFLPLRIAGLMSTQTIDEVLHDFKRVKKASRELGTRHKDVFIVLSFLALPVIPSLKITDKILVISKE